MCQNRVSEDKITILISIIYKTEGDKTFLCVVTSPTKGEGGHIGFSVDPVGVGVSMTNSCTHNIS